MASEHPYRFQKNPMDRRFYLRDRISGHDCIIDTGAEISYFPATAAEMEAYTEAGDDGWVFGGIDMADNKLPMYGVKLIKIDLGPGRQFTWRFMLHDSSRPPLIGFDLLKFYGLVVDIYSKKLETLNLRTNQLEPRHWHFDDVSEESLPDIISHLLTTRPKESKAVMTLGKREEEDNRLVQILVDTGCVVSVAQATAVERLQKPMFKNANGVAMLGWTTMEMSIPGLSEPVKWEFRTGHPLVENILGADALHAFRLRVDCRNRTILPRLEQPRRWLPWSWPPRRAARSDNCGEGGGALQRMLEWLRSLGCI